jgi:hypothetical protein
LLLKELNKKRAKSIADVSSFIIIIIYFIFDNKFIGM